MINRNCTAIKASWLRVVIMLITIVPFLGCKNTDDGNEYFVFSGQISGFDKGEIKIMTPDGISKQIKLEKNGSFRDTLERKNSVYFVHAPMFKEIYSGSNGGELRFQGTFGDGELKNYSFSGDNASETRFLNKWWSSQKLNSILNYHNQDEILKGEKRFFEEVDKAHASLIDYIDDSSDSLPTILVETKKAEVNYARLVALKMFRDSYGSLTNNKDFQVSQKLSSELTNLDKVDENGYFNSRIYNTWITNYYSNRPYERNLLKDSATSLLAEYNKSVLNNVYNERVRDRMLYNGVKDLLTWNENTEENIEEARKLFLKSVTNEEMVAEIEERFENALRIVPGRPSPKFYSYDNHAGGKSSLDDFNGKLVYIDFWATWCGPCKQQFPYLKEIEEEYHDRNIEFVSISLDKEEDRELWMKMVNELELGGVQLLANKNFEGEFEKAYLIKAIPRFVLLDRQGYIIDSNAPRPSDYDAITTLFKENGV
ncbi:TlpA family protein disulfide reductase [Flagellimonas hymeniacidonis]|uniref:TlpA family protein disulfide reductase n=1 Tax=Flagellimonas hymeniacidonis TaxID=2603628 RepID=A0A5C8V1D9_9FLAO|nr:TlpA disulfide reductase family protein [Flagellimonas hymeniacidonis]TXN34969.1 TlpA family protein disulfide reductase [Flagellimonas hymeniacidonis]